MLESYYPNEIPHSTTAHNTHSKHPLSFHPQREYFPCRLRYIPHRQHPYFAHHLLRNFEDNTLLICLVQILGKFLPLSFFRNVHCLTCYLLGDTTRCLILGSL